MSEECYNAEVTALEEIILWSKKKLPLWQQDALRRLLQKGKLQEEDIQELIELCKIENGQSSSKKITSIPVQDKDIPTVIADNQNIALLQISEVLGVNALSNKEELKFSQNGLTVIYGDNGAGKSGYSRIIKKITRSRASVRIHPNAFEASPTPPQAKIEYSIDDTNKKELVWNEQTEDTVSLGAVSFF